MPITKEQRDEWRRRTHAYEDTWIEEAVITLLDTLDEAEGERDLENQFSRSKGITLAEVTQHLLDCQAERDALKAKLSAERDALKAKLKAELAEVERKLRHKDESSSR